MRSPCNGQGTERIASASSVVTEMSDWCGKQMQSSGYADAETSSRRSTLSNLWPIFIARLSHSWTLLQSLARTRRCAPELLPGHPCLVDTRERRNTRVRHV